MADQIIEYSFINNKSAVLDCLISGSPPLEINWLRFGESIIPKNRHRIFKSITFFL